MSFLDKFDRLTISAGVAAISDNALCSRITHARNQHQLDTLWESYQTQFNAQHIGAFLRQMRKYSATSNGTLTQVMQRAESTIATWPSLTIALAANSLRHLNQTPCPLFETMSKKLLENDGAKLKACTSKELILIGDAARVFNQYGILRIVCEELAEKIVCEELAEKIQDIQEIDLALASELFAVADHTLLILLKEPILSQLAHLAAWQLAKIAHSFCPFDHSDLLYVIQEHLLQSSTLLDTLNHEDLGSLKSAFLTLPKPSSELLDRIRDALLRAPLKAKTIPACIRAVDSFYGLTKCPKEIFSTVKANVKASDLTSHELALCIRGFSNVCEPDQAFISSLKEVFFTRDDIKLEDLAIIVDYVQNDLSQFQQRLHALKPPSELLDQLLARAYDSKTVWQTADWNQVATYARSLPCMCKLFFKRLQSELEQIAFNNCFDALGAIIAHGNFEAEENSLSKCDIQIFMHLYDDLKPKHPELFTDSIDRFFGEIEAHYRWESERYN